MSELYSGILSEVISEMVAFNHYLSSRALTHYLSNRITIFDFMRIQLLRHKITYLSWVRQVSCVILAQD